MAGLVRWLGDVAREFQRGHMTMRNGVRTPANRR